MRISDWSRRVLFRSAGRGAAGGALPLRTRRSPRRDDGGGAAAPAECAGPLAVVVAGTGLRRRQGDRKSVVQGKRVSGRVDLGGRRIIKNKILNCSRSRPNTQSQQLYTYSRTLH